jgi:outer membrane lipoprotein LolB
VKLRIILVALTFALGGCSTLFPPSAPPSTDAVALARHLRSLENVAAFSLVGRMAVQTEKRGLSGAVRWKHTDEEDHILIFSPLGSQVADIRATPRGATLVTADKKTLQADSPGALFYATTGMDLPLTGLTDWVLGRPATGTTHEIVAFDDRGRLIHLRQDGWDIEYDNYQTVEGADLPGKVLLKSRELNFKLLIEQWGTLPRK